MRPPAKLSPALQRALPIAAVPDRLCPALWGEIVAELRIDRAESMIAVLEGRGWLHPTNGDSAWEPSALARARGDLERRDPVTWRQAHLTCARFFARRGAAGDLGAAVVHFVTLGDRPSAEDLLRRWGPGLVDRGSSAALLDAVTRLCDGDAPSPRWLAYLVALARERTGALAASLDTYERALGGAPHEEMPRWLPEPAAICGHAGTIAVRLGQIERAALLLEKARITCGERLPAAALHLAARIDMARGDLAVAADHFAQAAHAASEERDAAEHAEALSGMGVIAMREGDPLRAIDHYRRALAVSIGEPGEGRTARIRANLAMALTVTGRWEAAAIFEEVARERERLGDLAGAANSIAAGAAAREGAGDPDVALSELARARHLAEMGGDPALLLEIRLLRSGLTLRLGQASTALSELRAAEELRSGIERPDPLLDAMLDEARAEVASSRRAYAAAACLSRRARRAFERHRAHYFVARVDLLLARNALAAGRSSAALRHLTTLARRAGAAVYRFPARWAAERALALGVERGDAATSALCRGLLGSVDRGAAPRESRGADAYRIVDRRGARVAGEAEVERVRRAGTELLVDLPRQQIVRPSGPAPLSGQRVLVPLLLALLGKPEEAFDARRLHREVWGSDQFDESARTRVKVALSRLRALVGPGVIASRTAVSPTGASRKTFAVSPSLDYVVIERG